MTLAVGMLCEDGLILSADTRISYTDGSAAEGLKLKVFESGSGVYAVAQSSDDNHAADSLVAELKAGVQKKPPKSLLDFVAIAKKTMNDWYVPVYDNRPLVQLLVGLFVADEWGFYFCEPPNTVTFIRDKYKAIGDARMITDHFYGWFDNGPVPSPHATLCQVGYLMHKAKKIHPFSVGGATDAVVLIRGFNKPLFVDRMDMRDAESHGENMDGLLAGFAAIFMQHGSSGGEEIARIARQVFEFNLDYRKVEFHCQFPDKTIRHKQFSQDWRAQDSG
jgi:hypothetical protein